jgi:hypothetical protein
MMQGPIAALESHRARYPLDKQTKSNQPSRICREIPWARW